MRIRPSNQTISTLTVPVLALALALALASPAFGQAGASEARGQVLDREGEPVQDAVVSFIARANQANPYTAKTNKKGRYWAQGLYTPKEGDMWDIVIEREGMLPVHVTIESRTVNRVLVGDIIEEKLTLDEKIPAIKIRPLGHVIVDFTMAPEEVVRSEAAQPRAVAAAGDQPAEAGASSTPAAAPKKDPWDEGARLAAAGDLTGAAESFAKAVDDEPEDAERHEALAKVLYQLERYDEATLSAETAIELAPAELGPRMVLYSIQVGQDDLDGARQTLESAVEIAPEDRRVLEQLAFVAERSGNDEDAIAAYERLRELDAQDSNAWLALGGLYAQAGRMQDSEMAYAKVVELAPDSAYKTFYNLGALIMNRDDRDEADTRRAIEAFRRAVEIKPDYAEAQRQLGFALLNVADRAGAREALQAYVELRPDAPDTGQMRAIIQSLSK